MINPSEFPKSVLRELARQGVIHDPLEADDLVFLDKLGRVWRNPVVLRAQISKLNRRERGAFLETADLPTQWERWLLTRIQNDRPVLGRSPTTRHLIAELRTHFDMEETCTDQFLAGRIRAIRRMATNRKFRAKPSPDI